jgi:hypothetical protein
MPATCRTFPVTAAAWPGQPGWLRRDRAVRRDSRALHWLEGPAAWPAGLGGERLAQTEVIAARIADAGVADAVRLVDGLLEDLDASGAQ